MFHTPSQFLLPFGITYFICRYPIEAKLLYDFRRIFLKESLSQESQYTTQIYTLQYIPYRTNSLFFNNLQKRHKLCKSTKTKALASYLLKSLSCL